MSSYSRQQLEEWLKTIDVKGTVLDVGGSQKPIKGRTNSWEVEEYKILDLEKPHEEKQKPDIMEDIQDSTLCLRESNGMDEFDVAFCIEVSEYWYDPWSALKNICNYLKQGGILYISFHFIYPVHQPEKEDYLRYTPAGAIRLLTEAGFEIEETANRELFFPEDFKTFYEKEKMRGIKNLQGIQGCMIKARKL